MADEAKKDGWSAPWNAWSGAASVLGALGLLNMVQGFVELKQGLRDLLSAWSAVVTPLSEAVFGWIRLVFTIDLPKGFEDYLTLGVIAGTAAARAIWISMREINAQRAKYLPFLREAQRRQDRFHGTQVTFSAPEIVLRLMEITREMDFTRLKQLGADPRDVNQLEALRDGDAPVNPVGVSLKLVLGIVGRLTQLEVAHYRKLTPATFSMLKP